MPCDTLCIVWAGVFAVLCALVGTYAVGLYAVTLSGGVRIGELTPPLAEGLRAQPAAIFVHALASGAALVLCSVQALPAFRRWASVATHRALGWAYVGCVALGSASGAALSRTAVGGAVSTAGFGCLAAAWAAATAAAVVALRVGRPALHARLMTHSAALAFAAVTLRIYLPAAIFAPRAVGFAAVYRAISWLCWVPNVVAVEVWFWLGGAGVPEALLASAPGSGKVALRESYRSLMN